MFLENYFKERIALVITEQALIGGWGRFISISHVAHACLRRIRATPKFVWDDEVFLVPLCMWHIYQSVDANDILTTASISPPAWDQVGFLTTTAGTTKTVFGVFGECVKGGSCSSKSVGYDLVINGATFVLFPSSLKANRPHIYTVWFHSDVNINQTVLHNLTYAMILYPIRTTRLWDHN